MDQLKERVKNNRKFSYDTVNQWTEEMILGVDFLHTHNIIHRDIKPA